MLYSCTMIGKGEARLLSGNILKPRYEYTESSFSVHQRHVISLLMHGFLPVNARLLIAFGTAFYAIMVLGRIMEHVNMECQMQE